MEHQWIDSFWSSAYAPHGYCLRDRDPGIAPRAEQPRAQEPFTHQELLSALDSLAGRSE